MIFIHIYIYILCFYYVYTCNSNISLYISLHVTCFLCFSFWIFALFSSTDSGLKINLRVCLICGKDEMGIFMNPPYFYLEPNTPSIKKFSITYLRQLLISGPKFCKFHIIYIMLSHTICYLE